MMAAISNAYPTVITDPQIRPFDARRDLAGVADLVEICFSDTLDPDGRDYLGRMRSAASNATWLNWVSTAEWATPSMSGYVWNEGERIIGNVSLIPYYAYARRFYLIANVAVHPSYRRQGIGRKLTWKAIEHARARGCPSAWLHVRADNPGAVNLYRSLGFLERARRTSWYSPVMSKVYASAPTHLPYGCRISSPPAWAWGMQKSWLERSYPSELSWHMQIKIPTLRPGLLGAFNRFVYAVNIRQWAVLKGTHLLAALACQSTSGYANSLWLAVPDGNDPMLLPPLLDYARRRLPAARPLLLDYPAGQMEDAIQEAGFYQQQTLIWMEMPLTTSTR